MVFRLSSEPSNSFSASCLLAVSIRSAELFKKRNAEESKLLSVKLASAQDMQARGTDLLILHSPESKAYQQLSLTFEMFLIMSLRKYSQGDRTDWSSKEITLNDYNIICKFIFFYFCKC